MNTKCAFNPCWVKDLRILAVSNNKLYHHVFSKKIRSEAASGEGVEKITGDSLTVTHQSVCVQASGSLTECVK